MKELIKIDVNENQEPIVGGRELYEALGVRTPYTQWFDRMCEYGFVQNQDYCLVSQKCETNNPRNPYTTIINHAISLDMAKEIAMIQRNEKGKEVRKYFIQVEKDFNSPEKIMARALRIAEGKINTLQLENAQSKQIIGELKPKADYTDKILQSKGTVTVNAIANDYGMTAYEMNKILYKLGVQYKQGRQWLLYSKYRGFGYTHSKTIHFYHKDGTPDTQLNMEWTQKGRLFLYRLLKEKDILPLIERYNVEVC